MTSTSPRFGRKSTPPPLRFQARDGRILDTIYAYDGVMARRQIKHLFWPKASQQAMERRLSLLFHASYLNMPSLEQRRSQPIPEPIVWLGWRGILHMAAQQDIALNAPSVINENRLRQMDKAARQAGLRWQREPRWSQLEHDIAVNDFRMTVEAAIGKWPSLNLQAWITEGEFLSEMDTIKVPGHKKGKGVRPDGFFVLEDHMRQINNSPAKARFLLELDNSTHPLNRFARQKAVPGLAYIRSQAYRQRFGYNSGRWLVVCKSKARLGNLKATTEKALGAQASIFFFALLQQITPSTVLNQPIWQRGGSRDLFALVNNIGAAR
jgi:hypothetical protein